MTTTLLLDLRDPAAPVGLPAWFTLWNGDGSPYTPAWDGLAGPPGAANGDTHRTRAGDRSHPVAPATVSLDDATEVVLLDPAPALATEFIRRWFAPGTIVVAAARGVDGQRRSGARSVSHIAADGRSVTSATRPVTTVAAAASGALVVYRNGDGVWRAGLVA